MLKFKPKKRRKFSLKSTMGTGLNASIWLSTYQANLIAAGAEIVDPTIFNKYAAVLFNTDVQHIQAYAQANGTCPDNGGPLTGGSVL